MQYLIPMRSSENEAGISADYSMIGVSDEPSAAIVSNRELE